MPKFSQRFQHSTRKSCLRWAVLLFICSPLFAADCTELVLQNGTFRIYPAPPPPYQDLRTGMDPKQGTGEAFVETGSEFSPTFVQDLSTLFARTGIAPFQDRQDVTFQFAERRYNHHPRSMLQGYPESDSVLSQLDAHLAARLADLRRDLPEREANNIVLHYAELRWIPGSTSEPMYLFGHADGGHITAVTRLMGPVTLRQPGACGPGNKFRPELPIYEVPENYTYFVSGNKRIDCYPDATLEELRGLTPVIHESPPLSTVPRAVLVMRFIVKENR